MKRKKIVAILMAATMAFSIVPMGNLAPVVTAIAADESSLRNEATPSVSYVGWNQGAEYFADGNEETFWNGHSDPNLETTPQWMMYDFGEKKAEITGSDILFFDDGGVVMPTAIKIEYTDENGSWKEVTPVGEWNYVKNEKCTFEFEKIVTSKIRVTMQHATNTDGEKMPVAVKEWYLTGELSGTSDSTGDNTGGNTGDNTSDNAGEELGTNLALTATAAAAYTNTYLPEGTKNINNGALATVDSNTSWNCWNAPEEKYPMEVTLTWDSAQTMSSTRVAWWADGGGVTWPGGASLYYLDEDGTTWKELPNVGAEHADTTVETNTVWNVVNFGKEISTTCLKLLVNRGSGYNGIGISEWEVYGEAIHEDITGATVSGNIKIKAGGTETLTGNTVPATLSEDAAYTWSVAEGSREYISIVGASNGRTVTVKGRKKGTATLKLSATREGVTKETETEIRVIDDAIESIDTYQTSTAAGVAPILPDSVVANGVEFDEPTTSTLSTYGYEYAETFNSKLVPVTWDAVDPASYAADQVGQTFTVKGVVRYAGEEYAATAEITVAQPAAAGTSNSSVTFENVQLEDDFWLPKQETNATASLNKAITEIEKASGGEPNFDNAIKKLNGQSYNAFSGFVFQDSDIYKSIEAISYTLSATKNENSAEMVAQREKLAQKVDSWIDKIEKVQYADGYIDTFFTLRSQSYSGGGKPGTHRFWEMSNHELYNAGHFLEAVVAYTRYREGIGEPDYRLYVAGKRFADDIVRLFGPDGVRFEVPGHEEVELALVKFGKLAEEYEGDNAGQKYFDTAKTLIDRRGQEKNKRNSGYNGGTYSQDATAFVHETNAVGHAVRANYFYTGITDIATLLPDEDEDKAKYINSLDSIWDSVTEQKTYITGGIGTTTAGSDAEGYGKAYDLPPDQSYCEICAAIGSANWNQRMNLLHEDGKYADMVETNLYNSILVGTNLDGNRFYYSTLLRVTGGQSRSEWFACACCPPNLMRTIAALGGYMYNVHNKDVFVNMYAASSGNVTVDNTNVAIKQETNYPWDGAVKMTVTPEAEKKFAMKVRIPGWVSEQKNQNVTIKVNGEAVSAEAQKGYVTIDRTWKAGDVINIDMPMEIRLTESHELVEATKGQVAIERGPIVYCIEKAGNAQLNESIENFDPLNFVIPRDAELTATYNENLLKGVVEITGDVKYATGNGAEMIDAKLQAIPYYAWNNRNDDADYEEGLANPKNRSTKMEIWAMADTPIIGETSVRDEATPSVSYVGWGMGAENFADGKEGTFWNGNSDPNLDTSPQWMMYDFGEKKAELTGCDIMFYDDGGGVMEPTAITIEYTDEDGNWQEVTPVGEWEYIKNQSCTYEFEKIVTSKIRVTMQHAKVGGSNVAVAVNEWYLTGKLAGASEPDNTATEESIQQLTEAVAAAESAYAETNYTADSWKGFSEALEAAKAVLAKTDAALQDEVDAAYEALQAAQSALVKKSDDPKQDDPKQDDPKSDDPKGNTGYIDNGGGTPASTTGSTTGSTAQADTPTGTKTPFESKTEVAVPNTVSVTKNEDGTSVENTEIPKLAAGTQATVTVNKDADGKVTDASADVTKQIAAGSYTTKLSGDVINNLVAAAGGANVEVNVAVQDTKGNEKYTLKAASKDLKPGNKLKLYKQEGKELVLVNDKTYTVGDIGNISVAVKGKGTYRLVDEAEANTINKKIVDSVKLEKDSVRLAKEKTSLISFVKSLNMANVKSVSYTSSKKGIAKVTKGGKVTAKKAGTTTIKVKVTLKNGTKKTLTYKVTVK